MAKSGRRLNRSPFLSCLLGVGLLAPLAFFILQIQSPAEEAFSAAHLFEASQYLFPEQGKVAASLGLALTEKSFLGPAAPPFIVSSKVLGSASGVIEPEENREPFDYPVEEGDTLTSLSQKFNISLETILWANNLTSKSILKLGQKLTILPITGLLHVVRERDTVSGIAALYKAKQQDIVDFNNLGEEATIYAGDFLVIPYGKKPAQAAQYTQVPLSQSYFICPIPSPCRVTQGLHWYNAIDFSNGQCGQPVYAAAGGVVQRTGSTSQGGKYVRLQHPNGVVTYYGHLSSYTVSPGAKVYQGQIIGYVGHTGHTIPSGPAGCHLHFDVRFAGNPFAKFSAGDTVTK